MATTSVTIRMDENLKKQTETLLEEMGLNMTTAITIFAKTVVRQRKIPFEIALDIPNSDTLAAMDDVDHECNLSKRFHSVADLMEDLNA